MGNAERRWRVNERAQALERLVTDLWIAWRNETRYAEKQRIRQQIRNAEAELARVEEAEHGEGER